MIKYTMHLSVCLVLRLCLEKYFSRYIFSFKRNRIKDDQRSNIIQLWASGFQPIRLICMLHFLKDIKSKISSRTGCQKRQKRDVHNVWKDLGWNTHNGKHPKRDLETKLPQTLTKISALSWTFQFLWKKLK